MMERTVGKSSTPALASSFPMVDTSIWATSASSTSAAGVTSSSATSSRSWCGPGVLKKQTSFCHSVGSLSTTDETWASGSSSTAFNLASGDSDTASIRSNRESKHVVFQIAEPLTSSFAQGGDDNEDATNNLDDENDQDDADDCLVPVYAQIIESEGPLTPEEMDAMWYSAEDYQQFRRSCKRLASKAKLDTAYMEEFQAVYEACAHGTIFRSSHSSSNTGNRAKSTTTNGDSSDGAQEQHRSSSQRRSSLTASSSNVSATPESTSQQQQQQQQPSKQPAVRQRRVVLEKVGLEDCIQIVGTPMRGLEMVIFRQMVQDRKDAIQGVLAAQAKLPARTSPTQREVVLASKSRYLSRHFRQLARVLGYADSVGAKVVQRRSRSSGEGRNLETSSLSR